MSDRNALTINSLYSEIKRACEFVANGAKQSGLDETAVFHIELACDEACTNIIEHAYAGEGGGSIWIDWQVSNGIFVVTIQDDGRSFNPDLVPPPPLVDSDPRPDEIESMPIGGLGLHFMRELMDEVSFDTHPDHGNTLVMKKRITGK